MDFTNNYTSTYPYEMFYCWLILCESEAYLNRRETSRDESYDTDSRPKDYVTILMPPVLDTFPTGSKMRRNEQFLNHDFEQYNIDFAVDHGINDCRTEVLE